MRKFLTVVSLAIIQTIATDLLNVSCNKYIAYGRSLRNNKHNNNNGCEGIISDFQHHYHPPLLLAASVHVDTISNTVLIHAAVSFNIRPRQQCSSITFRPLDRTLLSPSRSLYSTVPTRLPVASCTANRDHQHRGRPLHHCYIIVLR